MGPSGWAEGRAQHRHRAPGRPLASAPGKRRLHAPLPPRRAAPRTWPAQQAHLVQASHARHARHVLAAGPKLGGRGVAGAGRLGVPSDAEVAPADLPDAADGGVLGGGGGPRGAHLRLLPRQLDGGGLAAAAVALALHQHVAGGLQAPQAVTVGVAACGEAAGSGRRQGGAWS